MTIGVISDTHGDRRAISRAVKAAGQVDAWIHLGDHYWDAELLGQDVDIYHVAGNCDFDDREEMVVGILGVKVLITHGHLYGVWQSTERLAYRAEELGCKAALFGHTHVQFLDDSSGILLLNPGSPSRPRMGSRAGYALLYIGEDGAVDADLMGI